MKSKSAVGLLIVISAVGVGNVDASPLTPLSFSGTIDIGAGRFSTFKTSTTVGTLSANVSGDGGSSNGIISESGHPSPNLWGYLFTSDSEPSGLGGSGAGGEVRGAISYGLELVGPDSPTPIDVSINAIFGWTVSNLAPGNSGNVVAESVIGITTQGGTGVTSFGLGVDPNIVAPYGGPFSGMSSGVTTVRLSPNTPYNLLLYVQLDAQILNSIGLGSEWVFAFLDPIITSSDTNYNVELPQDVGNSDLASIPVPPTPLPGALPLLATGLGGLGLLGWRRKRKASRVSGSAR